MANTLVTGANRGIGYAIVQAIATRLPSSNIILGCRSKDAAQEAIQSLRETGVTAQLDYVEIDIESDASIEAAAVWLEQKYGKLDGKWELSCIIHGNISGGISDFSSFNQQRWQSSRASVR